MNRSFTPPTDDTKGLRFLYNTVSGRVVLKLLCAPWLSKLCGAFLSSRMSKFLILPLPKPLFCCTIVFAIKDSMHL